MFFGSEVMGGAGRWYNGVFYAMSAHNDRKFGLDDLLTLNNAMLRSQRRCNRGFGRAKSLKIFLTRCMLRCRSTLSFSPFLGLYRFYVIEVFLWSLCRC